MPPELAIRISVTLLSPSDSGDGGDRSVEALVARLKNELVVGSSMLILTSLVASADLLLFPLLSLC